MGLFDFASDIGKKLFGDGDDDAAERIQRHIEADNPGIEDLKVTFDDGVVTLSGRTDDPEALEKAILMAGNTAGVREVRLGDMQAPLPGQNADFYEIAAGDTLWSLARRFYGEGAKYTLLFAANREVIQDPDKIFIGQKIRVPAA